MLLIKRVWGLSLFFLMGLPAILCADAEPKAVVQTLQTSLIDSVRDSESYETRFASLEPVVESTHAFTEISKAVLGQHWDMLSEQERGEFVQTFTRFTVANYASQFEGIGASQFEVLSEQTLRGERRLVRAELTRQGGEAVSFDYVLIPEGNSWKIVNIVVRGVSDLAMKRSEFSSVIEREGFHALLVRLSEKIEAYARSGS